VRIVRLGVDRLGNEALALLKLRIVAAVIAMLRRAPSDSFADIAMLRACRAERRTSRRST